MLANALADGRDDDDEGTAAKAGENTTGDPNTLPEDKHHLKLPSNVDQYTGVPFDVEDEVYP